MIKLFFITIFIAELIIALTAIIQIRRINKRVSIFNAQISSKKYLIGETITDFRLSLEDFCESFENMKKFLKQKKDEYMINTLKNILIYFGIIFLKGKYKKSVLAYQFMSEIYDTLKEQCA